MAIAEGWICRDCWKANRPGDNRCYRCHAPRDSDQAAASQGRVMREPRPAVGEGARGAFEVLISLPAAVYWLYGWFTVLSGLLVLLLTGLLAISPHVGEPVWPALIGIGVGGIGAGLGMRRLSRAMRDRSPAAFAIGVALSLAIVAFTLWAFRFLPPGGGNPDWERYITLGVFGASAFLAALGLAYSTWGSAQPAER
jgi:hypothetical protein